jgi:hypothetical protein
MPIIPALESQRQEDHELEASMDRTAISRTAGLHCKILSQKTRVCQLTRKTSNFRILMAVGLGETQNPDARGTQCWGCLSGVKGSRGKFSGGRIFNADLN